MLSKYKSLTQSKKKEIFEFYSANRDNTSQITANEFNVGPNTVMRIVICDYRRNPKKGIGVTGSERKKLVEKYREEKATF